MAATPAINIEINFGKMVRTIRKQQGMTLQRFADEMRKLSGGALRLNPSSVALIEQGKRSVSLLEASQIAVVLQVPLSSLIVEDDSEVEAAKANLQGEIAFERIRKILDSLSDTGWSVAESPWDGFGIVATSGITSISVDLKALDSTKPKSR
jgi:transcriptional regulator with XRE-family HTH domain